MASNDQCVILNTSLLSHKSISRSFPIYLKGPKRRLCCYYLAAWEYRWGDASHQHGFCQKRIPRISLTWEWVEGEEIPNLQTFNSSVNMFPTQFIHYLFPHLPQILDKVASFLLLAGSPTSQQSGTYNEWILFWWIWHWI